MGMEAVPIRTKKTNNGIEKGLTWIKWSRNFYTS
jgi:hypothetical protein